MSLFICPTHGLHHGPFCCDHPQEWWNGEFADAQTGPSESFLRRRFNPDAPHSPVRFEPTIKGESDVVI